MTKGNCFYGNYFITVGNNASILSTSHFQQNKILTEFSGTKQWFPPEYFVHRRYLGEDVDLWGAGLLVNFCLEGTCPFNDEVEVVHKDLIFGTRQQISWNCVDFQDRISSKEVNVRLKRDQIKHHPWFRSVLF